MFQTYLQEWLLFRKARPTAKDYERLVDRHFKGWSEWPTFNQLEDWHRSMEAKPWHGNKGLSLLKTFHFWAIRRGYHPGPNPCIGIKRHTTHSRETVMTSQHVAVILNCLDMMPENLAVLLQVLLTTGCRPNEAVRMQYTNLDIATGRWVQPKTKNGKPHTTYLPTQAREAIAKLTRRGEYVFMGKYDHHYSVNGAERAWRAVRVSLGLADVRLHDFRRTFATHLYQATKDDYLVKRCINHHNPSVTAIYVRISQEEVAKAMQSQADRFYALQEKPYESDHSTQYTLQPLMASV
jgi:integrase